MTLKILHGMVDLTRSVGGEKNSSAPAISTKTAQPAVVSQVTTEAVKTTLTVYSKPSVSAERLPSFDRAAATAESIARRIRAEGEDESHAGLSAQKHGAAIQS